MLSGAFFGALLLATSSLVSAACPPAPVGSSIYTVDPITVTTKSGGKASDISFTINTGSGTIACTPDRSLLDRFEEGERFECKGLGNGRYEFAYYKGTQNAIWLRFDGYLYVHTSFVSKHPHLSSSND